MDLTTIIIISVLIIAIITLIGFLLRKNNKVSKSKSNNQNIELLLVALGGRENVINASANNSRLKITLENIELINKQKIENIPNQGVFLTNNAIQIIFSENKEFISEFIHALNL